MSTTSGPSVPLRIGKAYTVPAIDTDASAVFLSNSAVIPGISNGHL
jgi:hypothetical protein